MNDDGGIQYWQELGLQQQFDEVFKNECAQKTNASKNETTNRETEQEWAQ